VRAEEYPYNEFALNEYRQLFLLDPGYWILDAGYWILTPSWLNANKKTGKKPKPLSRFGKMICYDLL
jgi:hypothetical protein